MVVAVILGKRLNDDGSFSEILQRRMSLALQLYKQEKPDYIIVSGGIANPKAGVAEGQKMYDFLVENGVPEKKLIKETESMTTKENAKYTIQMAISLQTNRLILCTSKEHMNRFYLNPYKLFLKAKKKFGGNFELVKYSD
jgi:vancomycin permeability regulator SanA